MVKWYTKQLILLVCGVKNMTQRKFETLGNTMLKISNKIIGNYTLCKMLKYSDTRSTASCPTFEPADLMDKNVILKPLIPTDDKKESFIVILLENFTLDESNYDYKSLTIRFDVLVPFVDWNKVDNNLKPFAIMSEIDNLFNNTKLNGLGNLKFKTADIITLDDKIGGYTMLYEVDEFN